MVPPEAGEPPPHADSVAPVSENGGGGQRRADAPHDVAPGQMASILPAAAVTALAAAGLVPLLA